MSPVRRFLLVLFALGPIAAFAPAVQAQAAATAPLPPVTAADRVLGRADAPVTVIEYASFTCSHCGHWNNDVFPAFKTQFIDTGKVKLVFRDLPTDPQQYSMSAALIGRCAEPHRFFAVAGSFFAGQAALATGGGRAWFDNGIALSGKSREDIQACFADEAKQAALTNDVNAAIAAGVTSTPSFFVNGRRFSGDPTVEALATAIAAASPGR
ncbi:MAG: DsbA family protein [Brevundimonas sp.]|nr:DsbA family protein [Brevundimonas sp.]